MGKSLRLRNRQTSWNCNSSTAPVKGIVVRDSFRKRGSYLVTYLDLFSTNMAFNFALGLKSFKVLFSNT